VQRDQLADFLRRRREALSPAEVGLTDGPRRRTTGLRREEVAMLAGMSVDYIVRLEQGRSSQPSTQLITSLARALRLSDDERAHLFHLAGHQPPAVDAVARAGMLRMLDLLQAVPAMVLSDLGEVLAQNGLSLLVVGDQSGTGGGVEADRYLVHRWFTRPELRAVHPPAEQDRHGRELVADLRAAHGRRGGDAETTRLVQRLQSTSVEFARLWAEHKVAVRRADRKTFTHPRVGPLVMDCENLIGVDHLQRLIVLSPADAATRERLELLQVLGSQNFQDAPEPL